MMLRQGDAARQWRWHCRPNQGSREGRQGRKGKLKRKKPSYSKRLILSTTALTLTLLYLLFHLTLSVSNGLGRWDCPAAGRRQDSGADEFVSLWHWSLAMCAGSLNRSCLCPKLEPLIERPTKASSHLQE